MHEKETAEIIPLAIQHAIPTNKPMWCDSAEPDRIKTWKGAGYRAKGVDKGGSAGSVKAQIDWLKGVVDKNHIIRRRIYVAPHCVNTRTNEQASILTSRFQSWMMRWRHFDMASKDGVSVNHGFFS